MIGSASDVLLAYVNGSDTVNDWRNKTNALIHFINKQKAVDLPTISFGETPPPNKNYNLWFDTKNMVLMTWFNNAWRQFHHVYTYEIKFYQKSITNNKIVPQGFNALAVSPTIEDGVTVTVTENSILRIV